MDPSKCPRSWTIRRGQPTRIRKALGTRAARKRAARDSHTGIAHDDGNPTNRNITLAHQGSRALDHRETTTRKTDPTEVQSGFPKRREESSNRFACLLSLTTHTARRAYSSSDLLLLTLARYYLHLLDGPRRHAPDTFPVRASPLVAVVPLLPLLPAPAAAARRGVLVVVLVGLAPRFRPALV